MLRISAAHLPAGVGSGDMQTIAEQDGVQVVAPALTPADIADLSVRLATARERLLNVPVSRIIAAVDAAARRLRDPSEPERARVLSSLQAISGFSMPMAEHLLDRVAEDWLSPSLETLVREELGGPAAVESFIQTPSGRRLRAVAPPLGLHVFSGNVPGVGVTSIVRALLVRSAVLGKSAAAEPVLPAAFARLLASVDPLVGSCVAVTYWRGGDTALEDAALHAVGLVVHYGGADAIAALRTRAPARVRFVEHGPRISFAIVDRVARTSARPADSPAGAAGSDSEPSGSGAPLSAVARDLALAVALFDQQGCVSPQLAYVIGPAECASELAAHLATALEDLRTRLPRGRISAAEAAAIREMRTRAEFGMLGGRGGDVQSPSDLAWTVILSPDPAFESSCLNRTLIIKSVPDLEAVLHAVAPFSYVLQTVGISGFDEEGRIAVATRLADVGATRITSIAGMPFPPATWQHDGRGPLRELVHWVELES